MLHGQESELKKHIGHQVEITGMTDTSLPRSGATTSGTTAGTTTAGSTATTAHSMNNMAAAHLRVSAVRMISATCAR